MPNSRIRQKVFRLGKGRFEKGSQVRASRGRVAPIVAVAVVAVLAIVFWLTATRSGWRGSVAGLAAAGHGEQLAQRPSIDAAIESTFRHLTATRTHRKGQIIAYFESARRLAQGITDDSLMTEAFFKRRRTNRTPPGAVSDMALDEHFVTRYGEFYDILFVDRSGLVFHSMRYESDLGTNLLTGPLAQTKLAQALPNAKKAIFVDYTPYSPSDEPAAFFVVPVFDSKALAGWFVLQCPLNKLHSILSHRSSLGRTGETYLVNAAQKMVTESRFRPGQPNLEMKVETLAYFNAIRSGAGEQVIKDYRGVDVLSSYEAFELFGTKWIIVAEMDRAEVVTEHYKRHAAYFAGAFAKQHAPRGRSAPSQAALTSPAKRVDMNEFCKTEPPHSLYTGGVASCTSVAAVLPGRFAYLAHVGPTDHVYGHPNRGHNDCLGEMLNRLQQHDVYPCEMANVQFTIVAPHCESIATIVDHLLESGAELAQIRFIHSPQSQYANVTVKPQDASVIVEWVDRTTGNSSWSLGTNVPDLGSAVGRRK